MENKTTKTSIDRVMWRVNHEMNLKNAEFCRRIDESTQNLNNWIKRGSIPADKLEKVSIEIDRSVDWILTGKDYIYSEASVSALPAASFGVGLVTPSNFGLKKIEKFLRDNKYTLEDSEISEIIGYIRIKINSKRNASIINQEVLKIVEENTRRRISSKPPEIREKYESPLELYKLVCEVYKEVVAHPLSKQDELQIMEYITHIRII